ncbi:transcriptional regulator [Mycolicibacterium cosmeticum]|uniref:Transcriptional regulator, y4mF family n=1 Tax=Mycolicibacterium cosmeticum TaxID=258533 RepID=W9B113_MYCCO|nr:MULTISPECIES: helix-turn-helix domain-containing protein [Mycolicibacterium]MCX2715827.1 helix-turn-helix domain-containing protein [Mycolicibacterium sp. J2]TLH65091.1 transcriptional regulator [Mycolicibacterium cosmeticum]CDO11488.1 transcriptional regulator, y4mF family [Mycolicibacterium cosmeticum]
MMVAIMSWEKLGEAVRERRIALGLTQEQLADRGGPSTPTLRAIENNRAGRLSPRLRRSLERTLQWSAGSVDEVLAGQDATVLEPVTTTAIGPGFYLLVDRALSAARVVIIGAPSEIETAEWTADVHRLIREVKEGFFELEPRLEAAQRDKLGALIALLDQLSTPSR